MLLLPSFKLREAGNASREYLWFLGTPIGNSYDAYVLTGFYTYLLLNIETELVNVLYFQTFAFFILSVLNLID